MPDIETDRPALIAALLTNGSQLARIAMAIEHLEAALDSNTTRVIREIRTIEMTISQLQL